MLLSNQNNSRLFSTTVTAISFLQNIGLTLQNSMSFVEIESSSAIIKIMKELANIMTFRYWVKSINLWAYYPYFRIVLNIAIFAFFVFLIFVFKKMKASQKVQEKNKKIGIPGLPLLKKLHTLLVPILI